MANTVDVSKSVAFVLIGNQNDVEASKAVAFVVIEPGNEPGSSVAATNSSVFSNIVRKP